MTLFCNTFLSVTLFQFFFCKKIGIFVAITIFAKKSAAAIFAKKLKIGIFDFAAIFAKKLEILLQSAAAIFAKKLEFAKNSLTQSFLGMWAGFAAGRLAGYGKFSQTGFT